MTRLCTIRVQLDPKGPISTKKWMIHCRIHTPVSDVQHSPQSFTHCTRAIPSHYAVVKCINKKSRVAIHEEADLRRILDFCTAAVRAVRLLDEWINIKVISKVQTDKMQLSTGAK